GPGRLERPRPPTPHRARGAASTPTAADRRSQYPTDPVGYASDVLGVRLTPDQQKILRHLLIPPCRVDVPSANTTGKTFIAAVAVCWWWDNVNPGVGHSTAPRYEHVVNFLWGQIRLLRSRAGMTSICVRPTAPEISEPPAHV